MPTQKEIIESILYVINERYQEGVLRSQSDVAAGALAILRLLSIFDDEVWERKEDGTKVINESATRDKQYLYDHLLHASSNINIDELFNPHLHDKPIETYDIPMEILSKEVQEELKDPEHAGERAEITDHFSELLRKILNFNEEDATGTSSDEIKDIGKKFKDMSRRYKKLRKHYKYGIEKSQELKPEYDDLFHRCEEVLRAREKFEDTGNFRELEQFLEMITRKENNWRRN
jgi:hypothetical protein